MKIVGIDFGHGETSAGYVTSDTVIENEIPMSDLHIAGETIIIPSLICKTSDGEYLIAPSASQIAKASEIGICFKAPLISSDRYKEITPKQKEYFRKFLSLTYKAIVENPNNPLHVSAEGNRDFLVYIACPSGWSAKQIEAYHSFVTNDCGIPVVKIVQESRAAYISTRRTVGGGIRTQGGNVLVIDYGSSTIDFTYFNNDERFEPVHEGYPYGASKIEEAIFNYLYSNNQTVHNNIDKVLEKYGEESGRNVILYEIRKRKENYFSSVNHDVFILSINLRDLLIDNTFRDMYVETQEEEGWSKSMFLEILKPYINDLSQMLDDFLNKDGVSSIDKVILTGGASRMFFFKDLVCERYGVSKERGTLIVDLNPSTVVSKGIAAFGYMNEKSEKEEKPLWEDVNNFIANDLESIVRNALDKAVANVYYKEFSAITNKYKNGEIMDSQGRRNLDAFEDALIEFLVKYSTSKEEIGPEIIKAVKGSVSSSINKTLKRFANTWNYDIDEVNVYFDFDGEYCMTLETAKSYKEFMYYTAIVFINKRDFWGVTKNTPYKDRDKRDREEIMNKINSELRARINDLHYPDSLEDEINIIADAIRKKVQDIIDEAKLEMYK